MRYSPWITTPHRPDTRDARHILAFPAFAGKSAEDLAVAVWSYCVNSDFGFYHFWSPEEKTVDDPESPGYVQDPLSLVNSYGSFLCGTVARVESWLWDKAGLGGRLVGITGHVVSEAFYDGGWHLLDADLHAYHRHHPPRHHIIASVADCMDDLSLITDQQNPSDPYYLDDRPPESSAKGCYGPHAATYYPRYSKELRTMDYFLRPGEEIVRFYGPMGRWFAPPSWLANAERYAAEWGDDGPRERFAPHRTYGNGYLRYRPDLTGESIFQGALKSEGFAPGTDGLVAELDASSLEIPVVSPYVINGIRDDWKNTHASHDGAVLSVTTLANAPLRILVSTDDGVSFRSVDTVVKDAGDGAETCSADFTPLVENYYRYVLRIESDAAGTILKDLDLTTWFRLWPGTLPVLMAGDNEVVLEAGMPATVPVTVRMTHRLDEYLVSCSGTRVDEDTTKLRTEDGSLEAVFRLAPPYGSIAGMYFFASFHPAPPDERCYEATFEWAPSEEGPWTLFHRAEVPHEVPGQGHWPWGDGACFSCTGEPLSEVFVRVRSPFDMWEAEARMDVADVFPAQPDSHPLEAEFTVEIDGAELTRSLSLRPGENRTVSSLSLPASPVMKSIRLSVKE